MNPVGAEPERLPPLREDIRLLDHRPGSCGEPRWLIHDPIRDSFLEIGLEGFQLMSLWRRAGTVPDLAARVEAVHGRTVPETEIASFIRFLAHSRLTDDAPGGWRGLSHEAEKAAGSLSGRILHNYLFFKIPLVQPAQFLSGTLPAMRMFASRGMLVALALVALAGLHLASRQWGDLVDGLQRQMTLSGALLFAVTLFVMKMFHELGHAYVATAMGCRVRSMGLAVMLLAPMLYTDVTDSWRLADRRKRMAIDLAGVAVEIAIAALALFAWTLLPPGDSRDIALIVATSAVAMTLAVNLSPFMRFDGYYVFSDMLGVKNLQPRAFALLRWRLREALFQLGEPCPDVLRGPLRTTVILYGVLTMLYRLVLFTGIAILVYHMTFKALGIVLFLVEIVVFVLAPVWRELRVWWSLRTAILRRTRSFVSLAVAAGLLAAFVAPWSTQVAVPAVLEPAEFVRLFPSSPAEVRRVLVAQGDRVKAGDLLVEMSSARLEKELLVGKAKLQLVEERLNRRLGDSKDQAASLPLEKDRLALIERVAAIESQIAGLSLRAAIDGRIAELDPHLHPGRIVSREDDIGVIVADGAAVIRGYAHQHDVRRLARGNPATFQPDDGLAARQDAALDSIALSASATIDIPHLAEAHGGRLRNHPPQPRAALTPLDPIHHVTFAPTSGPAPSRPIRGVAVVTGEAQSFAAVFFRRALKVLVQESGA